MVIDRNELRVRCVSFVTVVSMFGSEGKGHEVHKEPQRSRRIL